MTRPLKVGVQLPEIEYEPRWTELAELARLAEEIGKRHVLNIVMVGFFGSITKLIDRDALRKAVADSVPPGTEEMNLRAFDRGYEYGIAKRCVEAPEAQPLERGIEGQFAGSESIG